MSLVTKSWPQWMQVLTQALGREMPMGVRTGLSFWLVLFNTEKTKLWVKMALLSFKFKSKLRREACIDWKLKIISWGLVVWCCFFFLLLLFCKLVCQKLLVRLFAWILDRKTLQNTTFSLDDNIVSCPVLIPAVPSFCLNSWDCFTQMFAFCAGLDSDTSYWFGGIGWNCSKPRGCTAQMLACSSGAESVFPALIFLIRSHPFTSREPAGIYKSNQLDL